MSKLQINYFETNFPKSSQIIFLVPKIAVSSATTPPAPCRLRQGSARGPPAEPCDLTHCARSIRFPSFSNFV